MIGRKCVLIAAVSVFGSLTVATAMSTTIKMLLITRFLTGLGLGGALPNVIALVTESVSVDRRSTAVGFLYASLPAGGAVASLIAAVASGASQWPVVYLAGGVAPASLLPAIAYLVGARPEFAYAVLGGGLVAADLRIGGHWRVDPKLQPLPGFMGSWNLIVIYAGIARVT